GESQRGGVAEVDQRMQARQRTLLAEAPKQRLRNTSVLRWFQTHLGENTPPSLDLRQLALRGGGEAARRDRCEHCGSGLSGPVRCNALSEYDACDQLRKVPPDLGGMLEMHHVPAGAGAVIDPSRPIV